jgi:hypothetical protein
MRTWTQILGVAALAFGLSATANAGTIDLIFTGGCSAGNGTATCTASASDNVTAAIVLNTAGGDTQMGGAGSAYQVSMSYSGGTLVGPSTNSVPAGWFPAGAGVDNGVGFYQSIVNGVDLFGTNLLAMPGSYTIGTMTFHVTGPGSLTPTIGGAGDAIVGQGGGVVNGEYTLNGGTIVPEPTTAALLGLGLGVLGIAGRRR